MTTRSTPTRLTLLALLALLAAASAGGCAARLAGTPPASETHAGAAPAAAPRVFRLDNRSFERLDVYVMDETREWYLGRVEPGARALLPLPRDSSFVSRGTARLAVLAGVLPGAAHRLRASREPGAVLTVWQPLTRLLRQEWMFAVGDLMGQFR
jgi:hypothetical protein